MFWQSQVKSVLTQQFADMLQQHNYGEEDSMWWVVARRTATHLDWNTGALLWKMEKHWRRVGGVKCPYPAEDHTGFGTPLVYFISKFCSQTTNYSCNPKWKGVFRQSKYFKTFPLTYSNIPIWHSPGLVLWPMIGFLLSVVKKATSWPNPVHLFLSAPVGMRYIWLLAQEFIASCILRLVMFILCGVYV